MVEKTAAHLLAELGWESDISVESLESSTTEVLIQFLDRLRDGSSGDRRSQLLSAYAASMTVMVLRRRRVQPFFQPVVPPSHAMQKKPHWFRPFDLLTIGLGGFVTLGLLVYALVVGVESPHAAQGLALMGVVAAAFFAIWVKYAYERRKWLATFRWIPGWGLMVRTEAYLLPDDSVVDALVTSLVDAWTPFHPNAADVLKAEVVWVYFSKGLDEKPINPAGLKVNGLTIAGTHTILVDYDLPSDPLEKTALRHELGHVIHGMATGGWDQEEHHAFMKAHILP